MTVATQQESRQATEPQRAALRGMWGKTAHNSFRDGFNVKGEDLIPDPEPVERRDCPNCGKKNATVDRWPGRDQLLAPWFRCCGARA